MSKIIKIDSVSQEALEHLQDKYNISQDELHKLIGNEVKVSDEVAAILEEAKQYGALSFEEIEEHENEEEQLTREDEEAIEEKTEDDEVVEEEEVEETTEEVEEQEEVETDPEKKKFVGDGKSKRENALLMLEQNEAFINLEPAELREAVRSAYKAARSEQVDINDKDFIERYLRDKYPSLIEKDPTVIQRVNNIHASVLTGVATKNSISQQQELSDTPLEMGEVVAQSAKEANGRALALPGAVSDMAPYIKENAEADLADKIKKYLHDATLNASGIQSLIIIRDIKDYVERAKEDYSTSPSGDTYADMKNNYISVMPIEEMGAVMAAVKTETGRVQIRFEDIDWDNEVEREVAFELLAQTQAQAKELGAQEPIIDDVTVEFKIDSMDDIQRLPKECQTIKSVAAQHGVEIRAEVELGADLAKNAVAQQIIDEVLEGNGIEPAEQSSSPVSNAISEMAAGEQSTDAKQEGLDAISMQSEEEIDVTRRAMELAARAIATEIAGPGMFLNSND